MAKPSGVAAGDVLLLYGASPNVTTGWTQLGSNSTSQELWIKTAGTTEPATYAITLRHNAAIMAAYSGVASWGAPSYIVGQTMSNVAVTEYSSFVVRFGYYFAPAPFDKGTPAGYVERKDIQFITSFTFRYQLVDKGPVGTGTQGGTFPTGTQETISLVLAPVPSQTTMQVAVGFSPEGQVYRGTTGDAQAVATLGAQAGVTYGSEVAMQSVSRFIGDATGTHALDFTNYDAYIETTDDFFGVLFDDTEKPTDTSRRLQPVRQDVGNNPAEIRPEFGDIFAQNDFSHGSGQTYFHQLGRDPKRYFTSEGFDIYEPGRMKHLQRLSACFEDPLTGPLAQADGLPFVGVGTMVRRGDGTLPGTWIDEDPTAGEADQTVLSLSAEGARLYAALGAAGVHVRSSAGVWSHLQPDGATDLNINPATGVFWLKDRLMVIGGTDSRQIFEVVADSTPTAIDTLKEGWRFVSVGEAGGFLEACAVNTDAAQSVIYSYGLNDTADAIERKSSTPMPIGQLAWVVNGTIGTAFIGGGKANEDGGYDPFLYRATVNNLGELDYILIRQEQGSSGADLSVRAITPIGDSVLVSWTLGSDALYGEARDGIAVYHLGRDSFARHLRREGGGGANKVFSILPYKGSTLVAIDSFGLYFEDLNAWVPSASLVTSLADWNNAGDKVWDQVEVAHDPLPAGASVGVEYTLLPQVAEDWNNAFLSNVAGSEGQSARLGNTTSRIFALRISSNISVSGRPVVQSYSVRSHPRPSRPEWDIVRTIRLVDVDQKDDQAEAVTQDPRERMEALRAAINTWITFYESGVTWTAFLTDVAKYEPAQPFYDTTGGETFKDAFIVQLKMTGTEG
jgi:hypothetical protein